MFTPLLENNDKKVQHFSSFTLLYIVTSLCLFILMAKFGVKAEISEETDVGGPPEALRWHDILMTYFQVGALARTMQHGLPYVGKLIPVVPHTMCGTNPMTCNDVCLLIVSGGPPGYSDPLYCLRQGPIMGPEGKQISDRICWEVSKMRCWNTAGGSQIWDGNSDWMLLKHLEVPPDSGQFRVTTMPWIHIRSVERRTDYLVFGLGIPDRMRTIKRICEDLEKLTGHYSIINQLNTVPRHHGLVLAGHSEGSGWAICADAYMASQHMPHDRRVLGTGSILSPTTLAPSLERLFVTLAMRLPTNNKIPNAPTSNKVVADVYTIMRSQHPGITFPQFSMLCEGLLTEMKCVDHSIPMELGSSVRLMTDPLMQVNVLEPLHYFKMYQSCFLACFRQSRFLIDDYFIANVPPFIHMPPPPKPPTMRDRIVGSSSMDSAEPPLPEAQPMPAHRSVTK